MERVKYTETRTVDGVEFSVLCLERMEYSGEWVAGGYRVLVGEKVKWFVGWPSNSDLKNILQ